MKLELEKTYTFSHVNIDRIIHALSFACDSTKKIKRSKTLHILITDERANYKNRLKFSCKKDALYPVKIVYSPKIRTSELGDIFQTYLEENVEIKPNKYGVWSFFPVRLSVEASYFKQRINFRYSFGKTEVKIAVDQILAFNPLDITHKMEPYFNMEIEAIDEKTIDKALRLVFNEELLNCIELMEIHESKGVIASQFCSSDTELCFTDYDALVEYVQVLEKECFSIFYKYGRV